MSVFGKIVTKIFGRKSDKDLKTLYPFVDEINAIYPSFETLSDDDIKQRFISIQDDLKHKIESSKTTFIAEGLKDSDLDDEILKVEQTFLDDKMAEVFAIVKDVSRRLDGTVFKMMGIEETWRMVHYDVQLIGGVVLHQGRIAEMKTGEGKTLVSTLPIALNAITGRGVHVITVNDYLAERDSQWMGILFNFLGLSVGCILNQMGSEDRKKMYEYDITYGTNSQFGFDYLRDNMSVLPEDQVQRGHAFAIVDEVDSVLVDEARTPLIISGQVDAPGNQQYTQWRNSIEGLLKKQTLLVNTLVSDAEKLLGEDDREASIKLLMAQRGGPKNRRLLKIFQQQGTQQMVMKMESEYIRDKKLPELDEALYFSIDERSNIIDLSEMGCEYLSPSEPENFVIPDLGEIFHEIENTPNISKTDILKKKEDAQSLHAERSDRIHAINQLLKAYSLFEKDVDYIVKEGKVLIVDEHTGRVLHGRRFSDGLHQSLEAKENVIIEKESQTMATITIQNYFRMYDKLAGMTGTASTEANEFMEIYKLDVVEIPPNTSIVRQDHEDIIYRSKREKYNATIKKIQELFHKGQPLLVGTTSVEESETLSRMLRRQKVPHNVLNAKQNQKEAEIIIRAGHNGAITIATNMAGRGTDIKLGEGVKENGGLFILGTGRHESRRIDLQLRGRSGRQGDPGESIFFLSLEDDLMRLFNSDRIAKVMDRMGVEEGEVITHSMVTKSIERAQKKVEGRNFGIRKHLLEYDNVMNQQREIVYNRRDFALHGDEISPEIESILSEYLDQLEAEFCSMDKPTDWDWASLSQDVLNAFSLDISAEDTKIDSSEELKDLIRQGAHSILSFKRDSSEDGMFDRFQKYVLLRTIDEKWREHLYAMDQLREGIGLRAYGQKNPLIEYKQEGFGMFAEMMIDTNRETLKRIFRTNISHLNERTTQAPQNMPKNMKMQHDEAPAPGFVAPPQGGGAPRQPQQRVQPVHVEDKVGRNDACPCGSGKKYKKCHGAT
ncbi:MAG: preprotein translocase subunit SecA [Candidatus Marinimicrobia bacterium]|nr:preprotein translocase subunit SecA [Candidatus Neomarinimicrobiota bacterium]MBT5956213.1 preprotein translocase subunit SecA [Candidatus Neomarinimicrobiota bacterium]MBT6870516.1 preprotein translocase subunit SecA [Candidatus Neomarinimicrobiota bacterium]MBT7378057.1 preprotein translocase subunit SecA [Candidatus Neomarinimicrobiota bacterium]